MPVENILLEPLRRNTAPCIAYANYKIYQDNPDATVVVAPSDHIILKEDIFTEVILAALNGAEKNNWLITLGIQPSRPDTGYGYIQFNENIIWEEDTRIKKVKTFPPLPQPKQ
jgi:mannose-1-phosphate guanylyltransferase